MIELYYWTTPNGHKVTMFLEETGLPYVIHQVDIGRGQQFAPEFLRISPNNRIPAIVDREPADAGPPLSVFESGAILLYLADKTRRFLSSEVRTRNETLQWLFWQVANLGPMAGQAHHFTEYAPERIAYAAERYVKETSRLYAILDKHLARREYIAGQYSIADMACYPWIVPHDQQRQDLDDFPHLQRWFDAIRTRPATQRAYACADEINPNPVVTDEAKRFLFGQDARLVSQLRWPTGQERRAD